MRLSESDAQRVMSLLETIRIHGRHASGTTTTRERKQWAEALVDNAGDWAAEAAAILHTARSE